jgi:hypothetical protein
MHIHIVCAFDVTVTVAYVHGSAYISGLQPHNPAQRGNETLYLFGPNTELGNSLGALIAGYVPPKLADEDLAFSFGIGASGSGVPFHVHGQGWSEAVHGRKRWLLYPPSHTPPFDPDESSASWLHNTLPTLNGKDRNLLDELTPLPPVSSQSHEPQPI